MQDSVKETCKIMVKRCNKQWQPENFAVYPFNPRRNFVSAIQAGVGDGEEGKEASHTTHLKPSALGSECESVASSKSQHLIPNIF